MHFNFDTEKFDEVITAMLEQRYPAGYVLLGLDSDADEKMNRIMDRLAAAIEEEGYD